MLEDEEQEDFEQKAKDIKTKIFAPKDEFTQQTEPIPQPTEKIEESQSEQGQTKKRYFNLVETIKGKVKEKEDNLLKKFEESRNSRFKRLGN